MIGRPRYVVMRCARSSGRTDIVAHLALDILPRFLSIRGFFISTFSINFCITFCNWSEHLSQHLCFCLLLLNNYLDSPLYSNSPLKGYGPTPRGDACVRIFSWKLTFPALHVYWRCSDWLIRPAFCLFLFAIIISNHTFLSLVKLSTDELAVRAAQWISVWTCSFSSVLNCDIAAFSFNFL